MLHHLAFVHIPAELTALQLRRDRPILFRAVVFVASPSASDKAARGRALKRAVFEATLEDESVDKMDLLLCLLTYIAWGWDHVLNRRSLSRLMMQAMSLAGEMRLDKPISENVQTTAHFTPGPNTWSGGTDARTTRGFLEQQRALLGCFVLSSVVSAYFGQVDALRWTPQMENGLAAISINSECPTDAVFAAQVRLQLTAQKAVKVYEQHVEQGQTLTETAAFPALMALSALQGQLQELQAPLSRRRQQRELLMAHASATELVINETAYAVNAMVPIIVSQFAKLTSTGPVAGITSGQSAGHERSRNLWQCVRAIKACTSALLALPPSDFAGISFLQWAQLTRSLAVLHHLTATIKDQAWDRGAVRTVIEMPVLLDRVVEKLELAAQAAGEHGSEAVFAQLARTMREFRVAGDAAREHRAAEEVDATWEQARIYGGGGAGGLDTLRPVGIQTNVFWPDEDSAGTR